MIISAFGITIMGTHLSGFFWLRRLMGNEYKGNFNYTQANKPYTKWGVYLYLQILYPKSLNNEKNNDITSQEADMTGQLHHNDWVYGTNVTMTKQEIGVGDSERPPSSRDKTRPRERRHSFSDFFKLIGQRRQQKKRSVWDRLNPIASSCCIPHTRGNIPAALHHGGQSQKAGNVQDMLIYF